MAKRQCKGKTKTGKRCQAPPLIGSDYCSAHSPDLPDSARFGSHEQATAAGELGGRPRTPRVTDRMRERVEEEVDAILAPYFEALTGAVLHGTYEGAVFVSDFPDLGARIAAAEKLLDRVYGKPTSTVDVASSVDVNLNLVTDSDLRERAADLRRRLAASRAVQPGRADARDGA